MTTPTARPAKEKASEGETRAGPGDAGASDAPRPLPKTPRYERQLRNVHLWFAAGAAIAGIILLLTLF